MTPMFRIAAIAGDGIGKEVLPEGLRVLKAAAAALRLRARDPQIEWASCDWYAQHGQMMPDDWKQQLEGFDAIYFGAVGWPATVPDHVSLWGSLLKFRREFDQYINLRPVRLFDGVPCPLAGRKPGDIDYLVVRENTEGEYTTLGGVMYAGTERESRDPGVGVLAPRHRPRAALRLRAGASRERASSLTVATKSNGIAISMPWWDGRADAWPARLPGGDGRQAAHRHPERALRAAAGALRRGRREQPVRRHPVRPGPGDHRHHRPGADRPT